jgi:hypothetical protein
MSPQAGDAVLVTLAVVLCGGGALFLLAACGLLPGRRGRRASGVPAPLASQARYLDKHLARLGHDMTWAASPGQLAACAGCQGAVCMTAAGTGPAVLTVGSPLADRAGHLAPCPGLALAGPLPAARRCRGGRTRLAGEPG